MEHGKTFQLMLSAVKWNGVTQLSDFTATQKRHILATFMEEVDDDQRDSMMTNKPFSKKLCLSLNGLSELSKKDLQLTQDSINQNAWENIESILDDILDDAQVRDFKESGGISDYEDAEKLDLSIRYRDARNDDARHQL